MFCRPRAVRSASVVADSAHTEVAAALSRRPAQSLGPGRAAPRPHRKAEPLREAGLRFFPEPLLNSQVVRRQRNRRMGTESGGGSFIGPCLFECAVLIARSSPSTIARDLFDVATASSSTRPLGEGKPGRPSIPRFPLVGLESAPRPPSRPGDASDWRRYDARRALPVRAADPSSMACRGTFRRCSPRAPL